MMQTTSHDTAADAAKDTDPKRASDDQDRAMTTEETLDEQLEDSMDGSDPLSVTHPGDHGEPVPSSGYTEKSSKPATK